MNQERQQLDAILQLEQLLFQQQQEQQQLQQQDDPSDPSSMPYDSRSSSTILTQQQNASLQRHDGLDGHTSWATANLTSGPPAASTGLTLDQAMQYLAFYDQQRRQQQQEGQQQHFSVNAATAAAADYFAVAQDDPPGLGPLTHRSFDASQYDDGNSHTGLWNTDLLLAAAGLPAVSSHDLDVAMGYLSLTSPQPSSQHPAPPHLAELQQQQPAGLNHPDLYAYRALAQQQQQQQPQYPYEQFAASETMATRPSPFIDARSFLSASDPLTAPQRSSSSSISGQAPPMSSGGHSGNAAAMNQHLLRMSTDVMTRNSSHSSRTSGYLGLSSASICHTDSITTRESSRSSRHSGPHSAALGVVGMPGGAAAGGGQHQPPSQYQHDSPRASNSSGLPRMGGVAVPQDSLGLLDFQGLHSVHVNVTGGHVPGMSAWPIAQDMQQQHGIVHVGNSLWTNLHAQDPHSMSRPSSDDAAMPSSYAQLQQQWQEQMDAPRLGHSMSLPVRFSSVQAPNSAAARSDHSAVSAPPAAAGWHPLAASSPSNAVDVAPVRQCIDDGHRQTSHAGSSSHQQQQQRQQQQKQLGHAESAPTLPLAGGAAATAHLAHSSSAPAAASAAGGGDSQSLAHAGTAGAEAASPVTQAPAKPGRTRVRRRKKVPIITQLPAWADADWTPHASVLSSAASGASAVAGTGVFLRRGSSGTAAPAATVTHASAPLPTLRLPSGDAVQPSAARTLSSVCTGRQQPSLYTHSTLPLALPSGGNMGGEASFAGLMDFQGTKTLSGCNSPVMGRSPNGAGVHRGLWPEASDPFRQLTRAHETRVVPPALDRDCRASQHEQGNGGNNGGASTAADHRRGSNGSSGSALDAWMICGAGR